MEYEVTESGPIREELWNEKTVRVHYGGFNLSAADFPAGAVAKKGLPLAVDFTTRDAKPVKTLVLAANLGASATSISANKNHIFKVGDHVGNGTKASTITAIDSTTSTTVDAITISAALGALTAGTVLTQSTEAGDEKPLLVANKLNYADVKITAQPHCSAIYAVDEVRETKLPYALTDDIKESLTNRFLIIP